MDFVQLVRAVVDQERNLVRHWVETCHVNNLQVSFVIFVSLQFYSLFECLF